MGLERFFFFKYLDPLLFLSTELKKAAVLTVPLSAKTLNTIIYPSNVLNTFWWTSPDEMCRFTTSQICNLSYGQVHPQDTIMKNLRLRLENPAEFGDSSLPAERVAKNDRKWGRRQSRQHIGGEVDTEPPLAYPTNSQPRTFEALHPQPA
jgi:hypothetical protein